MITLNSSNRNYRHVASKSVYEVILKDSKKSKKCVTCTRHLSGDELKVLEKNVKIIL